MPRASFLRSAAAALAIALLAAPEARADITAAEAWANTRAYLASFGGAVTGTLVEGDAGAELRGFAARFELPFGLGTLEATITGLVLVDNGDGTVTFRYGDGAELGFAIERPGEGRAALGGVLVGGFDMLASGVPGDVTYSFDVLEFALEASELSVEANQESGDVGALVFGVLQGMDVTGRVTVSGAIGQMRVAEADVITTTFTARLADVAYEAQAQMGEDIAGTSEGRLRGVEASARLVMPQGGLSGLTLNEALAQGMALQLSSAVKSSSSSSEMTERGAVTSFTNASLGPSTRALRLGREALVIERGFQGYQLEQLEPGMPFALTGQVARVDGRATLPMNEGDAPQPYAVEAALEDLAFDESLWALFDPEAALPRTPAALTLKLEGEMDSLVGLLDQPPQTVMQDLSQIHFMIETARLREFALSGLGVGIGATGALSFDRTGLETFDGLPAPTGTLELEISGVGALLDRLVEMGLLADEEASGAAMMLDGFTEQEDGRGRRVTTVEFDGAAGTITANGQRLR